MQQIVVEMDVSVTLYESPLGKMRRGYQRARIQ